ncbi:MAG TPA: GNAT family N-acetyltransferase [Hyphomicrobiaceae bacterium]|nr:GNAT family N-acetyltransferase [Hyphomicrobiaceae bacterium]
MAITVAVEHPLQDDVRQLIAELNATLLALTPPEFCFHMTAEQMAEPQTTLFVAREDGAAVACGALRRHPERTAEVKRMYTRPSHQGRGIGGRVLDAIEALAQREGFARLVLETGHRHPAAWRVYERSGFGRCGAVLDYPDSEYSVFYAKALAADQRAGLSNDGVVAPGGSTP